MTQNAGVYVRIWLHLLKEGGWHTEREISDGMSLQEAEQPSVILYQMRRLAYVVRRKGEGGRHEYGVTGACKLPRALNVGDITNAIQ